MADESDDSFATYESMAFTDANLAHSLTQIQGQKTDKCTQPVTSVAPTLGPIPISSRKATAMAKVAKSDTKWFRPKDDAGGRHVRWDSDMKQTFNDLANQSSVYSPPFVYPHPLSRFRRH
jgi:hypothetical protein